MQKFLGKKISYHFQPVLLIQIRLITPGIVYPFRDNLYNELKCNLMKPFPDHELVESEDHVEVNGVVFNKPFVEKPVSAEDHNIYIYYPTSAGGGSQRLFRKVRDKQFVVL